MLKFRLAAGLAISLISLYLALRNISLSEIVSAFSQASFFYTILAFLVYVGTNLAKLQRWKVLMGPRGRQVSSWRAFQSLIVGQLLNMVYPARVGDLSRPVLLGKEGAGQVFLLSTVAVEKLVDMFAYAILLIVLLLLVPLPGWLDSSGYTLVGITLLLVSALGFFIYSRDMIFPVLGSLIDRLPGLSAFFRTRLKAGLSEILESLKTLKYTATIVQLCMWTGLVWFSALLTNHLALQSMNLRLPWTASLLLLVALQAGISLPAVPGWVGLFEYICILSLGAFNVPQSDALSFAILFHAVVMLPLVLFGSCFLMLSGWNGRSKMLMDESQMH